MHIPDGILNPYISALLFVVAFAFLIWAWKSAKRTISRTFVPLAAVISAVVLIIQLFEFPVAGGASTWHIMGGTLVAMILGPFVGIISLTIVVIIQTLAFGEGGITSFGANVFNMAVIGALSFYIVKLLLHGSTSRKRLVASVSVAAFLSPVLTALAVGIEIGIKPLVGDLGGIAVTVPTMLLWYVPTGLAEALFTAPIVLSISKVPSAKLIGVSMLGIRKPEEATAETVAREKG
jgi:cobalt/nickel transport system permease protein